MKELTLTVNIDEANLILEGLGNLPFAKVYALVSKIQEQASQQIGRPDMLSGEPTDPPVPPTVADGRDD